MKAVDFIGSEFLTPKGGVLKVVEIVGKQGSAALFGCSCSICSLDVELYPELFVSKASNLRKGQVPCGCASNPQHTEQQNIIRVVRKAKEKNITYHGWSHEYSTTNKTKCNLECDNCGCQWETTRINDLLNTDSGCPSCAKTGYDPSKSGTFYVVEWTNQETKWLKFGITNKNPNKRFTNQKRNTTNQYKVLSLHYFDDGSIPPILEQLLKQLKDKYPSGITKEQMPDGHSETLSIDSLEELNKIIHPYKKNNKE
ncbi:hypothetical protein [Aeromonas dhakensis]|uniref:hypothetical protein n=1 Tax=Aeromonas dhakensis TaxID=196024 RepID=UPI001B39DD19|nr:hypothetical protein [Aeromonas dhakensis]MBQ4672288.1 hypothetical protein [Aeromonas dhakensis]